MFSKWGNESSVVVTVSVTKHLNEINMARDHAIIALVYAFKGQGMDPLGLTSGYFYGLYKG